MTSRYDKSATWVEPGDAVFTPPAPRVDMPALPGLDPASVFTRGNVRTVERTSPVEAAAGFLVRYAGLTVILAILALGLTKHFELGMWRGVLAFAALSTAAYYLLGQLEHQHSGAGVERHRLTVGGDVLVTKIDADKTVQLARIALEREALAAQREHNAVTMARARAAAAAQLAQHSAPQSGMNLVASYVESPSWSVDDLTAPAFLTPRGRAHDGARRALLTALCKLYQVDDTGSWIWLTDAGIVRDEFPSPWSKRGGLSKAQRQQLLGVLASATPPLLAYDDVIRKWRLDLKCYPTAAAAVDAVDALRTVTT
jgi:hypothetical protein